MGHRPRCHANECPCPTRRAIVLYTWITSKLFRSPIALPSRVQKLGWKSLDMRVGTEWVSQSDVETSRRVGALYTLHSPVSTWHTSRNATGAHVVCCLSCGGRCTNQASATTPGNGWTWRLARGVGLLRRQDHDSDPHTVETRLQRFNGAGVGEGRQGSTVRRNECESNVLLLKGSR